MEYYIEYQHNCKLISEWSSSAIGQSYTETLCTKSLSSFTHEVAEAS